LLKISALYVKLYGAEILCFLKISALYVKLYGAEILCFLKISAPYICSVVSKYRMANMGIIIGRDEEKQILEDAFSSGDPEFIALFGRRRVGKTYLIRQTFFGRKNTIFFNVTGMKDGKTSQQIRNFVNQIGECFYRDGVRLESPKNWFDALDLLAQEIKSSSSKKIVLFFDEFPWMATRKSELLPAFEYFWNQRGSADPRIKLIVCGSSAGWIVKKIINNRGGLYNRVTRRIYLEPFTLRETKMYLEHRKIKLSNYHIVDLYMVLGGIPFYLSQIKPGLSPAQIIAGLAFSKHSFLLVEFENLYATLFESGNAHTDIARIIASHRHGISQEELVRQSQHISSGGTLAGWLNDLEKAGFIERFKPFGAKKSYYYKMIDEYSLFYFYWIEPIVGTLHAKEMAKGYWEKIQHSPAWHAWAGYAFESLCYKHINEIKKALHINDSSHAFTWRYVPPKGSLEQGAQIDLLFDRDDGLINLCEIKNTRTPFVIDKSYAASLGRKIKVFETRTKTQKTFVLNMILAGGIKRNIYSEGLIAGVCKLDNLFEKT
jgi:hypothetical protein